MDELQFEYLEPDLWRVTMIADVAQRDSFIDALNRLAAQVFGEAGRAGRVPSLIVLTVDGHGLSVELESVWSVVPCGWSNDEERQSARQCVAHDLCVSALTLLAYRDFGAALERLV